eukprot:1193689-Prorocentrum_minimum.AAC.1
MTLSSTKLAGGALEDAALEYLSGRSFRQPWLPSNTPSKARRARGTCQSEVTTVTDVTESDSGVTEEAAPPGAPPPPRAEGGDKSLLVTFGAEGRVVVPPSPPLGGSASSRARTCTALSSVLRA